MSLIQFENHNLGILIMIEKSRSSCHAYMMHNDDIVSDVWLYNVFPGSRGAARAHDGAMPNPVEFCRAQMIVPLKLEDLRVEWAGSSPQSAEACIKYNGKVLAKLGYGAQPGWCLNAACDGPLARVLLGT